MPKARDASPPDYQANPTTAFGERPFELLCEGGYGLDWMSCDGVMILLLCVLLELIAICLMGNSIDYIDI